MKLHTIEIENILSVGHIKVDFRDMGVVLIEGLNLSDPSLRQNGAGKSTILGSVYYAIYGVMPNGKGADNIINRKVGKGAKVTLEFEKGGRVYTIIRSRKKNAVHLFCDGQDLTTNSAKNTDELILRAFGISEKLFSNAILFDSINSKKFATMGDKERKEVLVELLGLELYTHAHELAKADLAEIEVSIAKVEESIRTIDVKVNVIQQSIERDKQEQENRSAYFKKAEEALDTALQNQEEFLTTYINGGHLDSLKVKKQGLNDEIAGLAKSTTTTSDLYSEYSTHSNNVKQAERTINEVRNKFAQLTASKQQYSTSDLCPTCGNEMDAEHRQLELDKINEQMQGLVQPLSDADRLKSTEEPKAQEAYAKYQESQEKDNQFNLVYQDLVSQLNVVNSDISTLESLVATHENAVAGAQGRLESYREELVPRSYTDALNELSETRKATVSELDKLISEKTLREIAVATYSNQGVKSHVMDLSVPFLNERIHKYLGTLSGGTIRATLSTQKVLTTGKKSDKIDLVITNEFGADSYELLSAGERRRVDVSISLALQDLVMTKSELEINVLMYDEVFENLDEVGCENVIALLNERLEVAGSILVISHNESLKPLFNNVMTVIKEDGISSLLEGDN